MRASEVVGGLSVVGVIVLIGFAIADDASSDTVTTPTAPTILAPVESTPDTEPAETDSTTSTSSEPESSEPETSEPETSESAEPPVETEPVEPTTPTTASPTTTTTIPPLPAEARPGVRVRVVNAGGVVGAATFASGVLEGAGFVPANPGDAVVNVGQNTILFAPGQNAAAATVNESINTPPEFVIEASPEDPNWAEFGSELDVLVMIGPA